MLHKILLSTAIVTASLNCALADGPGQIDWNGGYVGAFAGYGSGDTEHINLGISTGNLDIKGGVGGLTVGYDWQVNNLVYGVELDAAGSGISGSHGPATFGGFTCSSGPCETEVDWIANLRGRVGYANNNWLYYAVGGVAYAGVDARIPGNANLQAGATNVNGWTVGGGFEYAFNQNWTTRVEMNYTDLGSWRYDSNNSDFNATAKFTTVKIGVNFRY